MGSCRELDSWTQDLVLPAVVWLSGLFNPQSFLTGEVKISKANNRDVSDDMSTRNINIADCFFQLCCKALRARISGPWIR